MRQCKHTKATGQVEIWRDALRGDNGVNYTISCRSCSAWTTDRCCDLAEKRIFGKVMELQYRATYRTYGDDR